MAILKKKEKKIYMALLCLSTIHFELYILIFTIVYIENGVESILTPLKSPQQFHSGMFSMKNLHHGMAPK